MPVELRPENELPFIIFQHCRNQMIMAGMDGAPVDISIPAIKVVMDFYGVGDNRAVFQKVLLAARTDINEIHEKRRQERQAKGE